MWIPVLPYLLGFARRTCPKCHLSQLAGRGKDRATVRCKHCGADIPPRKPPKNEASDPYADRTD